MKRNAALLTALALALTLTLSAALLTGCCTQYAQHDYSAEDILETLDRTAGRLGKSQLTQQEDLAGTRTCIDSYTGEYLANCDGEYGSEVVFGGASIYSRRVLLTGRISTQSGSASVRVRQNLDVSACEPDGDGVIETELTLEGGGNYIIIDYDGFCGTVELCCEYLPQEG